ncbi:hypothetical protein HPO96_37300 [Kribbella sandramycini]|uniref:EfeO-type cupredoxin-like domain-containing protein n=1 Tax=Kribbella sandramycini TaxID=60450 RepID=A0A7Y4P499_9ACTN|nr:hypothetical protein [Kribbella sandramycini]MBB6570229.1 hypothetical protein [Kribbella sandramycini]NOL45918.1 hypothetical protein [Kribbella sandramycini]
MRLSLRGVVAAALLTLVLAGCGSEEPAGSGTPTTTPPPTPTSTPVSTPPATTPPSTPASTPKPAADVTVDVTIAGGKVTSSQGALVKAKSGQTVLITAVSDVADSLHVHGYDETLDLKPGKSASVTFKTSDKGIFEVETHESGKLVFKLQVS